MAQEEKIPPELQAIYDKRFALCVTLNQMVNNELEKSVKLYNRILQFTGATESEIRARENIQREFEQQAQITLLFTEIFNGACIEE